MRPPHPAEHPPDELTDVPQDEPSAGSGRLAVGVTRSLAVVSVRPVRWTSPGRGRLAASMLANRLAAHPGRSAAGLSGLCDAVGVMDERSDGLADTGDVASGDLDEAPVLSLVSWPLAIMRRIA